ncbi:hypothetical protein DNI29_12945 [Hymenobacter sediminis]|uniref:hypothetical protein n=1 Tax=Hymenobacter sediminis TaxID=2218621 RepID=UPI000DA6D7F8|nr:hypothetical protein [Hymenobacter sediminis]RPD47057.1 hypothetical protein DNI29_12945 [Hymenobacter sediminis]
MPLPDILPQRVALICSVLLGGCSVYTPTIPSTPLVQKGEVEAYAGVRGLMSSAEVGAAWSPVNHVMLTTEAAVRLVNADDSSPSQNRQLNLGAGVYQRFNGTVPMHVALVGGVGHATSDVRNGNISSPGFARYQATYSRYYAQGYVAFFGEEAGWLNGGVSCRATWVDYDKLRRNDQPVTPATTFYLEPTVFMRFGQGALQSQLSIGSSLPNARLNGDPADKYLDARNTLIGYGLIFRPGQLPRRSR